jgi:beta-ureidopropionase / N-carbamoyl-L-amino-acid hydrolase
MTEQPGMPRIDEDRFARRFAEMSAIGATVAGGVHRMAATTEDGRCRDLLARWCREAGFTLETDRIGNMFARLEGADPEAPPLMLGSHLDSQPHAGAYDGPVGVLAALEVMETIRDAGIVPQRPVVLVNWTNEEGARFRPPLMGSGVFAGVHKIEDALASTDSDGLTLGEELARIGHAGDRAPGWPVHAYLEIHIEQGTTLETAGAVIGVVSGVVGIRDIEVTVRGEDTHAGPLAMEARKDALVAAAAMILDARRIGLANAPEARLTVGRMAVPSDSHSVVPGLVRFTLDLRHPDGAELARLEAGARQAFERIADANGVKVGFEPVWDYPPTAFDRLLRDGIARAADRLGHATLELPSRAGHDAWNMARICPAAMIFIPCRDGISHNEAEHAEHAHMAAAADVMLSLALDIAAG